MTMLRDIVRSVSGQKVTNSAKESSYAPLQGDDEQSEHDNENLRRGEQRQFGRWLILLNSAFFSLSIVCLGLAYWQSHKSYQWHLKQVSAYSPLLDEIDLGAAVPRYDVNELFNRPYSIYRGEPSEEVDAAWNAIADVGIVIINGEDVRRLGKDPSKTVKAPEKWGFGTDAHLAQIDGQHQIHCLNVLRKWGHYDYYFRPKLGDDPGVIHNAHRDHCVMLLLNTLTCQPSLDVITHNWVETQPFPAPDFKLNRVCKNYEKILDWQNQHRITLDQWVEISPEPGDFVLPLWPEVAEINRQKGWNGTD